MDMNAGRNSVGSHGGGLISFFVRHPVAANLVMAVMLLFGAYGIAKMNTQFFPTLISDNVTISVEWSGASAEDVEANILTAIEPEVRFLDNVDNIGSYAREGVGTVVLEFEEGTDMQPALSDVEQAVATISTLPEESEDPKVSMGGRHDKIARLALIGPFSESALKKFARQIRDDLIARGIDRVAFSGMRDEEYVINARERDLRRLGLTIRDVANTIGTNTRDRPSGDLKGQVEKQLRALSSGTSPQEIANLEIKTFPTGEIVRIRDVGDVKREFDDGQTRGFSENLAAIELTVQRALTADTLKSAKILNDYLVEIEPQLPKTLQLIKYEVSADYLEGRIMLLVNNGLTGLALVVIILFIFLNSRIALWVAMGIPVAMLCTVGIMWATGQTINMISLFALIMMLGIIVDDAIVVGEHTATRISMGDTPAQAAENGARKMFLPILGAGLTTVAAFTPIFLVGDTIGQIMQVLPLVVICVVIASLVECFFVLPGHLSHSLARRRQSGQWRWLRHLIIAGLIGLFLISLSGRDYISVPPLLDPIADPLRALRGERGVFAAEFIMLAIAFVIAGFIELLLRLLSLIMSGGKRDPNEPGLFRRNFDAGFNFLRDYPFYWIVRLSYNWRYVTIALCIASIIVALGFMRGGRVGFVFFPSPEAENISARVFFNAGVPEDTVVNGIENIQAALRQAEAALTDGKEDLIVAAYATVGEAGRSRGKNFANIDVQLTSSEVRTVRTPDIVRAWRKELPELPGLKRVAIFERRGGPPGRDLDIQLQSAPPAVLKKAALDVQDLLSGFPGVSGIADNLPYGKPELVMQLTARGRALGFTVDSVGQQIRSAFDGAVARRFADGEEEITIRVKQVMDGVGAGSLRSLSLRAENGEFVPLTEVVSLTDRQGFSIIQRDDGKASVSVTADVDYGITSNAAIVEKLEDGTMQAVADKHGVSYIYSGKAEERQKSFADLRVGAIVALIMIYLLLAGIFADYWRPFAVMTIIPFGIVGAIMGHYVMGYNLTILSLIGLLGLAGILVNNSIILMDRFDERLRGGQQVGSAAIAASCDRLRAVVLTSVTTIFGLLPLLFEKSVQAQFLMPMAITIVFGLGTATVFVLFLVPALIGIGKDVSVLLRSIYNRGASQGTGTDLTVN
ncbi:MAG: efflux RND transporter permease subunit [Stappiaceae bacterium]